LASAKRLSVYTAFWPPVKTVAVFTAAVGFGIRSNSDVIIIDIIVVVVVVVVVVVPFIIIIDEIIVIVFIIFAAATDAVIVAATSADAYFSSDSRVVNAFDSQGRCRC
jgi:hypothetical protein